jgi:hypothetical protein
MLFANWSDFYPQATVFNANFLQFLVILIHVEVHLLFSLLQTVYLCQSRLNLLINASNNWFINLWRLYARETLIYPLLNLCFLLLDVRVTNFLQFWIAGVNCGVNFNRKFADGAIDQVLDLLKITITILLAHKRILFPVILNFLLSVLIFNLLDFLCELLNLRP